ncbi:Hsp70 family protein [Dactylosporangium sp. NPDC051541]|uniref:Hsp70 family protein n=1 Tax=Dactylosporangium sp. NPDC051541 TaxID=3363977 RepID=UPI003796AC88
MLLTGRDAVLPGRVRPANLEGVPKGCIDQDLVWLGDREVPVVELVAAVLRRVRVEAERVAGGAVAEAVLTYPSAWGEARCARLRAAARAAGFAAVTLVPEPVAAAAWFARAGSGDAGTGEPVVVYDFGAGTFDVAVVRLGDAASAVR